MISEYLNIKCEMCNRKTLLKDRPRRVRDVARPKTFIYAKCVICQYRCCIPIKYNEEKENEKKNKNAFDFIRDGNGSNNNSWL